MKKLISSDLALYAVSRCNAPVQELAEAQAGGATFLQLREKELSYAEFLAKAQAVSKLSRVPFVVNDNVEIAAASGADGVHVGQGDAPLAEARAALGPEKIVGVSCSTVSEAVAAAAGGADYLGVGAVFPTGTKQDACDVPLNTLRAITASVKIPVVAIGGINSDNVGKLGGSGIAGVAVISALFGPGNVRSRTEKFAFLTGQMLNSQVEKKRGLLLDLDGLLLDSYSAWDEIDRKFLTCHNLFSEENLTGLHHCGTIEQAAALLRPQGLRLSDTEMKQEIIALLSEIYKNQVPLLAGARQFLEQAKLSGKPMVLLTASPEELVLPALTRLGIREVFDRIVCNADKSTPEVFYRAIEAIGTGIGETTVYDDTPEVLQVAAAAGFPTASHV